jgi:hypothetical protein
MEFFNFAPWRDKIQTGKEYSRAKLAKNAKVEFDKKNVEKAGPLRA